MSCSSDTGTPWAHGALVSMAGESESLCDMVPAVHAYCPWAWGPVALEKAALGRRGGGGLSLSRPLVCSHFNDVGDSLF